MSPMDRIDDRYRNDATFHAMVDTMRSAIENLQLSPSEVREAAMYACYMTEMRRPVPMRIDVVPAPGDRCGGSGILYGQRGTAAGKCPGCRACS